MNNHKSRELKQRSYNISNLIGNGNLDKAQKELNKTISLFGKGYYTEYMQANLLRAQKQYKEAVAQFENVLENYKEARDKQDFNVNFSRAAAEIKDAQKVYDLLRPLVLKGKELDVLDVYNYAKACYELEHIDEVLKTANTLYEKYDEVSGLIYLIMLNGDYDHVKALKRLTYEILSREKITQNEELGTKPSENKMALSNIYAALGQLHAAGAEYDLAFNSFNKVAKLITNGRQISPDTLVEQLVLNSNVFSKSLYDKLEVEGLPAKLDDTERTSNVKHIYIVGHSRAGKSLLERVFANSPKFHIRGESLAPVSFISDLVKKSGNDVLNFVGQLSPKDLQKTRQDYIDAIANELEDKSSDLIQVFTLPSNIWILGVLGLIVPEANVVYASRNLLSLGVSSYFQQYESHENHIYTYDLHALGASIACFDLMMSHWARVLPNPIYVVNYEELVENPKKVLDNFAVNISQTLPVDDIQQDMLSRDVVSGNTEVSTPFISLDTVNTKITDEFAYIGNNYSSHLQSLVDGYGAVNKSLTEKTKSFAVLNDGFDLNSIFDDTANPTKANTDKRTKPDYSWDIDTKVVVFNNGAKYLSGQDGKRLIRLDVFDVYSADIMGEYIENSNVLVGKNVTQWRGEVLGDGGKKDIYVTFEQRLNSTLELNESVNKILTVLPQALNTTKADDAFKSIVLDWLILDARFDNKLVLENAVDTLAKTLVLDVSVYVDDVYHGQNDIADIAAYPLQAGLKLLTIEQQADLNGESEESQSTQLAKFIYVREPRDIREAQRIALILDVGYGLKKEAHNILAKIDDSQAEKYKQVRGISINKESDSKREEYLARNIAKPLLDSIEQGIFRGIPQQVDALYSSYPKLWSTSLLATKLVIYNNKASNALELLKIVYTNGDNSLSMHLTVLDCLVDIKAWWLAIDYSEKLLQAYPKNERIIVLAQKAKSLSPMPIHFHLENKEIPKYCFKFIEDIGGLSLDELEVYANVKSNAGHLVSSIAALELALEKVALDNNLKRAQLSLSLSKLYEKNCQTKKAIALVTSIFTLKPNTAYTALAYEYYFELLSKNKHLSEYAELFELHNELREIWLNYKDDNIQYFFSDYGLLYQGFESLRLPGMRPTLERVKSYGIKALLDGNSSVLDIGCNNGFLLLALSKGKHRIMGQGVGSVTGFDISPTTIKVGQAVAGHLQAENVNLFCAEFDNAFKNKAIKGQKFDLIIASAVHGWIDRPMREFGKVLKKHLNPNGYILLESQGRRSISALEPGFTEKALEIKNQGFEVIKKDFICDDNQNRREFWILQKQEPNR